MLYILLTLGYLLFFSVAFYGVQGKGIRLSIKKPFIEITQGSATALSLSSDSTSGPAIRYTVKSEGLIAIILVCVMGGIVVFTGTPMVVAVSSVVIGSGIGFLLAVLKYDSWLAVETQMRQPQPKVFAYSLKSVGQRIILLLVFSIYNTIVSALTSRDTQFLILATACLAMCSFGFGFSVERLLLFLLHRLNSHPTDIENDTD